MFFVVVAAVLVVMYPDGEFQEIIVIFKLEPSNYCVN